jgi:hypothetical protein
VYDKVSSNGCGLVHSMGSACRLSTA